MSDDSSFLPGPQAAQEAFPPAPLCWPALTAPEREEQLHALTDWTRWLVHRYALDHRTVPPCWSQHGALLEELSALRTAWLTAYAVTSTGDAPLDWHAHFAAARQRLADWVSRTGCRSSAAHVHSHLRGHRHPPVKQMAGIVTASAGPSPGTASAASMHATAVGP